MTGVCVKGLEDVLSETHAGALLEQSGEGGYFVSLEIQIPMIVRRTSQLYTRIPYHLHTDEETLLLKPLSTNRQCT